MVNSRLFLSEILVRSAKVMRLMGLMPSANSPEMQQNRARNDPLAQILHIEKRYGNSLRRLTKKYRVVATDR